MYHDTYTCIHNNYVLKHYYVKQRSTHASLHHHSNTLGFLKYVVDHQNMISLNKPDMKDTVYVLPMKCLLHKHVPCLFLDLSDILTIYCREFISCHSNLFQTTVHCLDYNMHYHGCYPLDWTTGLEHRIGLLDFGFIHFMVRFIKSY